MNVTTTTLERIHVRPDGVEIWIDDRGVLFKFYPEQRQWAFAVFRECRVDAQEKLSKDRAFLFPEGGR